MLLRLRILSVIDIQLDLICRVSDTNLAYYLISESNTATLLKKLCLFTVIVFVRNDYHKIDFR